MKELIRIIGGFIFALSYIFLFVPSFSWQVNLGILGMFIGFYITTNLFLWDLKGEITKTERKG